MEIYLLRHGIAVPYGTAGYPGDDRPLTEEGIEKMEIAAKGIAEIAGKFDVILTSPMKRAYETAMIIAVEMGLENKVKKKKELLPGAKPKTVFSMLEKEKKSEKILLAGHEPDFGYIASFLLGIDNSVIEFKKGGICRIDVAGFPLNGPGRLICLLPPRVLRKII